MKLVIEDEFGTRTRVSFSDDEIVVGRGGDGITCRLDARDVSRKHARFIRSNGAVVVEDLGSLTGTRINGQRITTRRKLRLGDLVKIGSYDLALLSDAEAGAPPPLPDPQDPDRPRTDSAATLGDRGSSVDVSEASPSVNGRDAASQIALEVAPRVEAKARSPKVEANSQPTRQWFYGAGAAALLIGLLLGVLTGAIIR